MRLKQAYCFEVYFGCTNLGKRGKKAKEKEEEPREKRKAHDSDVGKE
jgi:hypothetical protein